MLYVFNTKNQVKIAWNSTVSGKERQATEKTNSDHGLIGFIRTYSAG